MSIEKELHIRMTLDRSQAKRELASHEQESKRALKNVADSAKETEAPISSAMNALGAMVPTITGIGAASSVFSAVNQGIKETGERVKALTDDFIKTRDTMRELAGILGQKGDINFAQQQYEFAGRTGMNVQDSTKFREAFQGVAQQYKGKFANEGEFNKYEEQSARYAATMGLAPDVAADLSGAMIRNMKQGGTAQDAMLAFGQSFHTMQQGSGSNKVLASQLREVTSSMVGPGMAFSSPQEAAVAVRTMAESNPEEAATMLQRMRDGQLKLSDTEKAELGVDSRTPLLEMIKKVGDKANKSDLPLDEYLKKLFPLAIASRGFGVGIRQGIGNNVIQKGMDDVNEIGAGETESGVDATFADPKQAMMLRQKEAERKAADAQAGHAGTLVAPYLEQARTQMAGANNNGWVGGARGLMDKLLYMPAVFGLNKMGPQQQEEYARASGVIQGQAREQGVDVGPALGGGEIFRSTPDQLNKRLAEMVELLRHGNEQRARQAPARPQVIDGKPNVGFPR